MSSYGVPYARLEPGTKGGAKQSFRKECDINRIVANFAKTGLLTPVETRPAMFIDVSNVTDYRTALDNVRMAEDLFMELPAITRAKFENDPATFLDFASDAENDDEMRKLGLLPPLEGEEPKAPEVKEPKVPEVKAPEVPSED